MALDPQFLGEKAPLNVLTQSPYLINLAEVRVKPAQQAQFKQIVLAEMQQAVAKEKGVLVMYAATLKDQPNVWRFFEIYTDQQAYTQHRATAHFQTYLKQTATMVEEKQVIGLDGWSLMSKGQLHY